ncbi:phenylalanine--tRNA ligase subunit beta [Bdellovibrio sp. qaytius]|nr:phenylalanine--tRNA ligase subunit beta [Bdellovibrio sp. qaytius]
MKISLQWLNDFVDVTEFYQDTQKLADHLTRAGLEVEDIQNKAKDFNHVVVGQIQVKDKHPNSDKLSLCQVDIGGGKIEQIVCGAQNHKQGDKVIVALVGAVLPGNFAIKKAKVRDVESNGMLCSLKELGLATESEGIAILPTDAPVGELYAKFGGYDDIIFELKVTPNRADCLSHYGLAREIGCLLNKPVKNPEVQKKFSSESTKKKVKLTVENSELCPRYCGRYITGVKIGDSPAWLKRRLESIGMNSINNVVDVTNYVMLEMGQPLHAFDANLINDQTVVVRNAKAGEKFKTLKEQELTLKGDELVIADSKGPVALAGVIGGIHSGVVDNTTNLFLEAANFKAMSVRKSSRQHGVDTDSSYRFSRGVDPSQTFEIMDRAVNLILQVAGGEALGDHYDVYPKPVTKSPVKIDVQTISDRLGYLADADLFEQYMKGLHCKVDKIKAGEYNITPPLFRFDLERDMDLVEEYARLKGYEHITETLPTFASEPAKHDEKYMTNHKMSLFLRGEGYDQAFNYAFTSDIEENKWITDSVVFNKLGLTMDAEAVKLRNPLSEDLNVMRRSLVYPMWKNIRENFHAGNSSGKLFEIGSTFSKVDGTYKETRKLIIAAWGEDFGLYSKNYPLVYKLKSTIESLLQNLQISAYTVAPNGDAPSYLHKGQWASLVCEGKAVGYIGTVHPVILADDKIRVPVAIAEINLDYLLAGQPRPTKFKPVSGFQPVDRDFAFVMGSDKMVGDLTKEVKKSVGVNLQSMTVFDVYEGDKMPVGQKSVALRVRLHSHDVALTEAAITEITQKVVAAAQKSVGANLR